MLTSNKSKSIVAFVSFTPTTISSTTSKASIYLLTSSNLLFRFQNHCQPLSSLRNVGYKQVAAEEAAAAIHPCNCPHGLSKGTLITNSNTHQQHHVTVTYHCHFTVCQHHQCPPHHHPSMPPMSATSPSINATNVHCSGVSSYDVSSSMLHPPNLHCLFFLH